ncbi:MAG: hypothetical protein LCH83_13775 [Proteobacteria bacterium]|nr:hypothetical protein [Pseudomonadota bacterium]
MGEASKKHKRHKDILLNAKGCIYCAGKNEATQIDHMPPRAMFRLSQRPKGLEFPSCSKCNQGTSKLDLAAALMARTFPGIASKSEDTEWSRLMAEINRAIPGLLQEMWVPPSQMREMLWREGIFDENLAGFKADGPILSAHMQAFAAKVGFALHYEATGNYVPKEGRVQVRWFTSTEFMNESLPLELITNLGKTEILKQGKITSEFDFEYGWALYEFRNDIRLYYAKVRSSFVIAAFVVEDVKNLPFALGELATFAPGDLVEPFSDRIKD